MEEMACILQQPQKKRKITNENDLELFPNEILIKIFDYLSLDDLYQSFKGLNQRIDKLLQSLNNRGLRLWSTEEDEVEIHQFFSFNVIALNITDEYDIDLKLFPNVCSLTYVSATDIQLQHLPQSTFCHQRLIYLNVTSEDLSSLIQHIFSNGFPSLQQCILRYVDDMPTFSWKIVPSLRSIDIHSEESLITSTLTSCPNLTRLSLFIYDYTFTLLTLSFIHHQLKHLSINIERPGWHVQAIETFLSSIQLPGLISFRISSRKPSNVPFDFVQLAQLLDKHVPHLKRFGCDIFLSQRVARTDLDTIRHAHPFLFRHLQFEHQSDGTLLIFSNITKN